MNKKSKYSIVIFICFISATLLSMTRTEYAKLLKSNKQPTITRPYEPSLEARYPRATHYAVGLGTTLAGSYAVRKIIGRNSFRSIFSGVFLGLGAYVYKKLTFTPSLLNTLIINPEKIAQEHSSNAREYYKNAKQVSKTSNLDAAEDFYTEYIKKQLINGKFLILQS